MSTIAEPGEVIHVGTSVLFDMLTPEQIERLANLPPDPRLAARVEVLADKANEGELTESEREEYEEYIAIDNLMAILQAEARFRIAARKN